MSTLAVDLATLTCGRCGACEPQPATPWTILVTDADAKKRIGCYCAKCGPDLLGAQFEPERTGVLDLASLACVDCGAVEAAPLTFGPWMLTCTSSATAHWIAVYCSTCGPAAEAKQLAHESAHVAAWRDAVAAEARAKALREVGAVNLPIIHRGQAVTPNVAPPATAPPVRVVVQAQAVLQTSVPAPTVTRAAPNAGTVSGVRSVEAMPAHPAARVQSNVAAPVQRTRTVQNTPQIAPDRSLVKTVGGSALPNLHPATISPTPSKPVAQPTVRVSEGE